MRNGIISVNPLTRFKIRAEILPIKCLPRRCDAGVGIQLPALLPNDPNPKFYKKFFRVYPFYNCRVRLASLVFVANKDFEDFVKLTMQTFRHYGVDQSRINSRQRVWLAKNHLEHLSHDLKSLFPTIQLNNNARKPGPSQQTRVIERGDT